MQRAGDSEMSGTDKVGGGVYTQCMMLRFEHKLSIPAPFHTVGSMQCVHF